MTAVVTLSGTVYGNFILELGDSFCIGRSLQTDLSVDDLRVSRRHCRIAHEKCGVTITDLQSANGSYLNGQRITKALLREGDRLSTRDDGPQEIQWIGRRHVSGARMQAMPELRPIRVRAGALGNRFPAPDLLVSPSHRLLLRGAVAAALFNAREVLVAAYDMLNDRTILRDHTLREVTYFHLMLERHQIVWANGVESESFHPAHTSLGTIEPGQRERLLAVAPGIERNPHDYGDPARRTLSTPEAAILLHEARRRH